MIDGWHICEALCNCLFFWRHLLSASSHYPELFIDSALFTLPHVSRSFLRLWKCYLARKMRFFLNPEHSLLWRHWQCRWSVLPIHSPLTCLYDCQNSNELLYCTAIIADFRITISLARLCKRSVFQKVIQWCGNRQSALAASRSANDEFNQRIFSAHFTEISPKTWWILIRVIA